MSEYDRSKPWNRDVRGGQLLPLINDDAPVMRARAGPGTGKTFAVSRRVHRLVHPEGLGVPPDRVLVVAFNRVIASDLRESIERHLGDVEVDGTPLVRTIHALCLSALGEDVRLLLPHEREAMLNDVMLRYPGLRLEHPSVPRANQALRNHEAGLEQHTKLWQACQEWLREHRAQLVSDLPSRLRSNLRGGALEDLRFKHVIVDEFQDLSRVEQEVVVELCGDDGQMLALGDPRQSIYLFRGNDRLGLENLEELTGRPVRDIPVTECHRCPQEIVEAANTLMQLEDVEPMTSVSEAMSNAHVVYWKTPEAEAKGMAKAVAANALAHPDDRHLVMVTRRRFGYQFREAVHEFAPQIDVDVSFSESILELWPVREAFLWFCLLADADPCTWRAWLSYRNSESGTDSLASGRNAGAYAQLLARSGGGITPGLLREVAGEERGARRGAGGVVVWDRCSRYVELADAADWEGMTPGELSEACFDPARWVGAACEVAETAIHDIELLRSAALEALAEIPDAEDVHKRSQALRQLARELRYRIAVREPFEGDPEAAVRVTTLWGAKGLTADHVYVLGLCDEAVPGQRPDEYPGADHDHFEEQRRLFFVTITRSKSTLVLSRPNRVRWGDVGRLKLRRPAKGTKYWAELRPSQFLRDVEESFPAAVAGEKWKGCQAADP